MHETLKLYIPDNDCECNRILKVCALFVNYDCTMNLKYIIELNLAKKENLQKFNNIISK